MGSPAFAVSTCGRLETGFERETVINGFCNTFGIGPDKAVDYIDQRKLIRKGLSRQDAEGYRTRLREMGVSVVVTTETDGKTVEVPPPVENTLDTLTLVGDEPDPSTPSAPSAPSAPSQGKPGTREQTCPKCSHRQPPSDRCEGCGIYFDKFNAANKASAPPARRKRPEPADVDARSGLTGVGAVLGVLTAVVAAFAWKLVVDATGYELGLLAWAIGGAIGTVIAVTGGQGTRAGVLAAVLTLSAIVGGRYLVVDGWRSELFFDVDETAMQGDEFVDVYRLMQLDAPAWTATAADDAAVREFMWDYDYADYEADSPADIDADAIERFREDTAPLLEMMAAGAMSYETFVPAFMALQESTLQTALDSELSTVSLMVESVGLLDIVFLFLGISTAFSIPTRSRRF